MDPAEVQRGLQAALGAHYALERELGHGGMATVYLARDLRHRRQVAVKVLHPELSAALGAERFLREIELTASLQHPHILPLFDSGSAGDVLYYVMPFIEGETLRARLAREWQLPVDTAVRLAREAADALSYAHAHGVVHRDIKPENILLQGGHALVADFGIALAVQEAGGERLTRTGLSLGTPQYMALEQAMGERLVDARTDVYALGVVTYEMLAGEPPFTGPTAQGIVAKMLAEQPVPLTQRRRSVPSHVEAAVHTALEKLPADRFESASAFAAALSNPAFARAPLAPNVSTLSPRLRPVPPRLVAMLAVGALAAVALAWAAGRANGRASAAGAVAADRAPLRFTIDVDSGSLGNSGPAISPDGRTVVYAVQDASGARLYARRGDDLVARPIPGTEDGQHPFFSPDGGWVAFYSHGALRKVHLDGGSSMVVTEVPASREFAGGSWGDDTILYAVFWNNTLYRVSASGGASSPIALADTMVEVINPHLLPGGRAALVTAKPAGSSTGERIAVLDLATGRLTRYAPGFAPKYVVGQIVYATSSGELFRQPFNLSQLMPSGPAEQIASGLPLVMSSTPPFDASRAGALVFRMGGSQSSATSVKLSLMNREGRELRVIPARLPWTPRFSPDGRRVAYGARAPDRDSSDLWIAEVDSGTPDRVTNDANESSDPSWSPDGKSIAYSSNATGGASDLFIQALDGGPRRLLTQRPGYQFTADWFRDGNAVLFVDVPVSGSALGVQSIWVQPLNGTEPHPYLASQAHVHGARASPDGRWVAYPSDETGRFEVYIESYPTPGRRTTISSGGGTDPAWRRDGKELYYWHADQLIAVRIEGGVAGGPPVVISRTPLFRAPYPGGVIAMYDVSPDGRRFIIVLGHERANRLVVALQGLKGRD